MSWVSCCLLQKVLVVIRQNYFWEKCFSNMTNPEKYTVYQGFRMNLCKCIFVSLWTTFTVSYTFLTFSATWYWLKPKMKRLSKLKLSKSLIHTIDELRYADNFVLNDFSEFCREQSKGIWVGKNVNKTWNIQRTCN
jgi:hypothetical protein